MIDVESEIRTAGAYILYKGYFVFMFGFGSNHPENELGVVRFGGHREKGESVIQCITREVKEESSLDITFYRNKVIYIENEKNNGYQKIEGIKSHNPILILRGQENKLSVMYLAYGSGILVPKMETQGILYLRKEDLTMICSKYTTFREYKENGGKFLLVSELPENAILSPLEQAMLNSWLTLG